MTGGVTCDLRNESGFSIIEVLVSAMLVVTISVGLLGAFDVTGSASGRGRARTQASLLAHQAQDQLRANSPVNLANLVGVDQVSHPVLGGQKYQVTTQLK